MKKMVLINIITIVALVIIGVVGFYFYHNATSYVLITLKLTVIKLKLRVQHLDKLNLLTQNKVIN